MNTKLQNGFRVALVAVLSVAYSTFAEGATDATTTPVYRVTAKATGLAAGKLTAEGLADYAATDIFSAKNAKGEDCVYLDLPNGTYSFSLSDGNATNHYFAIVNGLALTVEPLVTDGFFVNGVNITEGEGDGWSYNKAIKLLSFKNSGSYVLTGVATNNEVHINVSDAQAAGATVILSNAVVLVSSGMKETLNVAQNISLLMAGGSSYLAGTNNNPMIMVHMPAVLTVDLAPNADESEAMLGVFNYRNMGNVIGGTGSVVVNDGTLCLCGNNRMTSTGSFAYGTGELMMGGETFDALQCIRAGVSCKCILFKPGVAVTPGTPLVFETAEAATNALKKAELVPHEGIWLVLTDDTMYQNYCNMFEFDVVPTADDKWAVEAFLKPDAWTNVVKSAQMATRQIPVAKLAAQEYGNPLTELQFTNCVPGFYYSLYSGATATNLKANIKWSNCNNICNIKKEFMITELAHPSPSAGFFAIGVQAAPTVIPGETDYHSPTGAIPRIKPQHP